MSQIQELTNRLQRELYSKSLPGEVVLNLREKWLERFVAKYQCNIDALMLGFMFVDFKLQEATELRRPNEHIRMAHDYAAQAFERYTEIPSDVQAIVLDIIDTQHGGNHKHLESKLFKNADAMAFLEPKGWLHYFGSLYDNKGEYSFNFSLKKLEEKFAESFSLVDLDQDIMQEALMLKEKYDWIKTRLS